MLRMHSSSILKTETSVSGSYYHPQLSGRWRKAVGLPAAESARPVVVPVLPRISVSQLTTYPRLLVEELAAIAGAGLEGIGLSRTKLSKYDDETVAAVLREFGVKASSVSWAGGFMGSLGFSHDEALDDARDAIRQAALWGAENLVIVLGSRNGHAVGHFRKTIKDALLLLANEAGDHSVRLALLPMHPRFPSQSAFFNGVDDTLSLLDALQHPQAGLAFDACELVRSPELMDRIPSLAARTFLVQLGDAVVDASTGALRRCLPGQGELPLAELAHRFLAAGYRGPFDVQVWSDEVWQLPPRDVMTACNRFVESVSGAARIS